MDGVHEAWLMNRFEHDDTPPHHTIPILLPGVPLVNSTCTVGYNSVDDFLYFQAVSPDYCVMLNV